MKSQKTTMEMPYNLQAEEQAIAILLKFPKDRQEFLNEISFSDMFYSIDCKTAFNAISSLIAQNKSITDVTLNGEMVNINSTSKYNFIEKISKLTVSSGQIYTILENLKKAREARVVVETCYKMIDSASSGVLNKTEITTFKNDMDGLLENTNEPEYKTKTFEDVLLSTIQKMGSNEEYLSSGFEVLDSARSFLRGGLTIIGARPSMGKTALALNILSGLSKSFNCLFFSIETQNEKLMMRIASNLANIPFEDLHNKDYFKQNANDIANRIYQATKDISKQVKFQDRAAINVHQMRSYIQKENRILKDEGKQPISVIIVDYLQLMNDKSKSEKSREQEVAKISRDLKILAKDLNLSVIALAQVGRDVAKRTDKRPQMQDLRESGAIEQDADVVMFLHRPEYYGIIENEQGLPTKDIAEIIIAKNRDGKTGVFEMKWLGQYQRFDNLGTVYLQDNSPLQPATTDGWEI